MMKIVEYQMQINQNELLETRRIYTICSFLFSMSALLG